MNDKTFETVYFNSKVTIKIWLEFLKNMTNKWYNPFTLKKMHKNESILNAIVNCLKLLYVCPIFRNAEQYNNMIAWKINLLKL